MRKFGIGQPIRRVEDQRFLTGRGQYLDDINLPKQLHAFILRSPHAHAAIRSIDASAALASPGIVAVVTGADIADAKLGSLPVEGGMKNRDRSAMKRPPRPALAQGVVRHVGDSVAMILAESLAEARDAADLVAVDYEPLPAVVDATAAQKAGAPQVWPEAPGNLCLDWEKGDGAKVKAALAQAHHVTRLQIVNNRLVVNSMETRGALAAYEPGDDRYTLYVSSQGSHYVRDTIAKSVLDVPADRLRVITPDVGGGFGMKGPVYPEYGLVLWAARRFGRPVKWVGERSDAFLTDTHGRDHVTNIELGLDKDGKILALDVEIVANMGAYLSSFAPVVPTVAGCGMLVGIYMTPALHVGAKCTFTHTTPVDAYRGAGRPEAIYVIERVIDKAAQELGLAPAEIRRRNFIPPTAMPYRTPFGDIYDSGEFDRNMRDAMRLAGWDGIEQRKADAKRQGKRRGIGMATYIETCGGAPDDMAEVRVEANGAVTLLIGTQSSGQGHQTAYAQIVAEDLGIPVEKVRVVQGDTDQIPYGNGTGGSRSLPVGGSAVRGANQKIIGKGKRLAATLLEAAAADIEFADGVFVVAGTDRRVTMTEVAAAAYKPRDHADGLEFGLAERAAFLPKAPTYPNGCHIAEVEIDVETGIVGLVAYTVVDDFGKVINPLLLAGQVHGGTVQGIGQALFENCVFDRESGQLLSGSFMDYRVPRASDVPFFNFTTNEVPCRTNPLGMKGAGEAGSIGAPPAVINAIVDALGDFGISHIDMPATPERVWRAINSAAARA